MLKKKLIVFFFKGSTQCSYFFFLSFGGAGEGAERGGISPSHTSDQDRINKTKDDEIENCQNHPSFIIHQFLNNYLPNEPRKLAPNKPRQLRSKCNVVLLLYATHHPREWAENTHTKQALKSTSFSWYLLCEELMTKTVKITATEKEMP